MGEKFYNINLLFDIRDKPIT